MNGIINVLRNSLELNGFNILQISGDRILIFRSFSKFTKCIYIHLMNKKSNIEIKVDKVFDVEYLYRGIERLLISKKTFNNIEDSLNYIQNIIVSY